MKLKDLSINDVHVLFNTLSHYFTRDTFNKFVDFFWTTLGSEV